MKPPPVFDVLFRMGISFEDKQESSLAFQGVGDITADRYVYLEGSAPRDDSEIGISHLIAKRLGAQSITFDIRPLEVYVLYPLIVFAVTMLSGMCAALQVRKIPASDASDIE